jgi:2-polyprenyl-6-methoxyphenol hydroxylase-like FAD-dependent oxidoreductase
MVPDVVIVGGGPIGLAAAIAARQRGLAVLIADRARPPIDRPCGEGLMPGGVSALRALGVRVDSDNAIPFYGIRFTEAGLSAQAYFPAAAGHGLGIRRPVLHQMLALRAAEVGVVTRWGEPVTRVSSAGVRIAGRNVPCRWIVGADGRGSRVRRWTGFRPPSNVSRRIGLRQHFQSRPWTDFVEVHWHNLGQAVVTPVASNEVCISVFANSHPGRMAEVIKVFPELCRHLNGARATSSVRGTVSGSSNVPSVVRDRIALIGDASGSVDALTGEGLSLGFRQAIALAEAFEKNDLAQYQVAHRRMSRMPDLMAGLMLFVGARAWLRRRVLHALNSQSQMFGIMLGAHVGVFSPTAIRPGVLASFVHHLFWVQPART